jgi:hypothetical protein
MRGSIGPAALGLMLVELRAVTIFPSRPGSGLLLCSSSPLLVPGVCDGVSGLTSWWAMANSFARVQLVCSVTRFECGGAGIDSAMTLITSGAAL